MSGISIISNFDLNQTVPLDSRLVASNSTARDAIQYKYDGLKVYQLSDGKSYLWNGVTWSIDGNGIYGGSGSLLGNTEISLGNIGGSVNDTSYSLSQKGQANTNVVYFENEFSRHTGAVSSNEWLGLEYKQQFKYYNGTTLYESAYIAYNPIDPNSKRGGISFNTGDGTSYTLSEKMRITPDGKIGINTNDPKGDLQIGTSSVIFKPIVIHTKSIGNIATIGHNWYPSGTGTDLDFDSTIGSSKIVQNNGNIIIQNRPANGTYNNTLFVGTASRVGIMTTTPGATLDVNGTIKGNNLIVNGSATVSSGDLVVQTGAILNYEIPTNLTWVDNKVIWSNNNIWNGAAINGGSFSSNWNLSTEAYRIGNLINLKIELESLINPSFSTGFYGIILKVSSSKFRPNTSYYGLGNGWATYNATPTYTSPIIIETFTSDPSTGGSGVTTLSGNEFWIRIRVFKGDTSTYGNDFLGNHNSMQFRGNITYVGN
jgi:hypothetical protein